MKMLHLKSLLNSYAELFFLQSPIAGGILLLVTLSNPNTGLAGLISVLAAFLFARMIGMDGAFLTSGFFTYNTLLVGLSIGHLFALKPLTLFLVVIASLFTFVLTVAINSVFSYYLKLPILSIPFVLVSSIAYLASYGYSNLYITSLYAHGTWPALTLPVWLQGFLVCLGAILFAPNPWAGAVVALVILAFSRILFLLALGGFLLGATISGLMQGGMQQALLNVNNFNFILIAMALGGVFLIPSPKSYLVAAVAVASATLLQGAAHVFWASFGVPAFTLPFNMVTLTFLYVLGLVGFPLVALVVRRKPEETLEEYLSNVSRFPGGLRRLCLPFAGGWSVWQGFNGSWTHQGSWRHAYDFVIERNGRTFQGEGARLEDYFAFRKPVLSPCRGRVVRVVNNIADNPPGVVDKTSNWGNMVLIDTLHGFLVELSHFARQSIRVKAGDWVEVGSPLGTCGNSGYSPQPHIHLQVQGSEQINAPTLPFTFLGYMSDGCFVANGLPEERATVEPLHRDANLDFRTAFLLDQRFTYDASLHGEAQGEVVLTVAMAPTGETFLQTDAGRLYFAKDTVSFHFYRLEGHDPWLSALFAAVPRLPLVYRKGMVWSDSPPLSVLFSGFRRDLLTLLMAFLPTSGRVHHRGQWEQEGVITGYTEGPFSRRVDTRVVLHQEVGFSLIEAGGWKLERKENEGS